MTCHSTAAQAYRVLRAMLNSAVADELIVRNPCRVEGAATERAPERPVITIQELEALAEAIPERWQALVLLAAWCGLRRAELLGLRRSDLDLMHGTVRIERTHGHLEDGRVIVGPPKTEAGRRTVAIPRTSCRRWQLTSRPMSDLRARPSCSPE